MTKMTQPDLVYLSNGIPVVLQSYDGSVASTYWWIKTGSGDEAPAEAGFAHFLEHMLFKDAAAKETGKASTGQMATAIESLGGDINAYTSFDQTVYHVTCAAQHWEKVLNIFSTIAKPQKFLKADFEREREVILEELRKNQDSPGRQLFQQLFSTTFKKHPYGRPVIGFVKTLKAAKVTELERFYRNHYVSERMGLILVGPFGEPGAKAGKRKAAILKTLESRFGKAVLPKRSGPVKARPAEPALNPQSNWVVKPFDVKTPTVSFSFRVPGLNHEDIPALDLLSSILGMGELSRLHQRLFYQTSLATEVSAGLYVPKDPGMLYFQADVVSENQIVPAVEEIFKEFKRIQEEGPTLEELSRVMVNAESERLYSSQTADGMAGRLGFLQFIMGDLTYDRQYLDELRAVDSMKIREVAKKYLDLHRMSGVVMVQKPQEAEAGFDVKPLETLASQYLSPEAAQAASPAFAKARASAGKKSEISTTESFRLPSGLRVTFQPRPSSQVFSIHASVLGGVRLEMTPSFIQTGENAESNWGSSYMMSMAWTKGTSAQNANQITTKVEGRAAGMDGFSGRNSVGLQMTALARDWNYLSSLFTEVLLDPIFPETEVGHVRRIAEDSIRGIEDHSARLCSKLFLESLFESHPYGKMIYGSAESLTKITSERLKRFHRSWVRPDRLVVSVSGNVKRDALEAWLVKLDKDFASIATVASGAAELIQSESSLKAPRWIEKPLGRGQLHIMVGGLGLEITSKDRVALQLLETLLGGQSGRLFIELREKKSLAYSVSPVSFEGIERGYIGTYIACSPEKKDEALGGIKMVLEGLAAKGPTDREMKRAKEFYLGRRAMDLQGDSAIAAHMGMEALYGLEHLNELALTRKVAAVSPKEIQAICRRYLVDPYMVTSVVG